MASKYEEIVAKIAAYNRTDRSAEVVERDARVSEQVLYIHARTIKR